MSYLRIFAFGLIAGIGLGLLVLAASCGARPLGPPCNPGLDGGPAWCETTGGAVPSCKECPP